MATIATTDLLKITVYCQAADQVSQNVRYMFVTTLGAGVAPSDQELVDALTSVVKPLYTAVMGANAIFYGVSLQKVSPTLHDAVNKVDNGVGSAVGDLLPRETAGLISFKTGFGGRKNRGRMYVPFPAEGDNTATGHPGGALQTLYEAIGDFFKGPVTIAPPGTATVTLLGVIIPSDVPQGRAITSRRVSGRWASMRRRGDYAASNPIPF